MARSRHNRGRPRGAGRSVADRTMQLARQDLAQLDKEAEVPPRRQIGMDLFQGQERFAV